jgi:predicted nucleic acid-binding protein
VSAYLDASVIVPRLVQEPGSATVDAFLSNRSEALLISDLAAAEVASALSRLVRMRLLGTAEASSALSDFEIWRAAVSSDAEMHAADARLAYAYVRRFDLRLRAPDALHLAIARRLDLTLLTLDRRLATAAAALGIAVAVPAADSAPDPR